LAFSALLLPLFFVVVYTLGPAGAMVGGVPRKEYVGAATLALVFTTAFMTVSSAVVNRREERIYKRLRGTALPTVAIFAVDVVHAVLVALVQEIVSAGYVVVALHAPIPRDIPLVLLASVVGASVFCALGLGVAGLLPSTEVAQLAAMPVIVLGALASGIVFP